MSHSNADKRDMRMASPQEEGEEQEKEEEEQEEKEEGVWNTWSLTRQDRTTIFIQALSLSLSLVARRDQVDC